MSLSCSIRRWVKGEWLESSICIISRFSFQEEHFEDEDDEEEVDLKGAGDHKAKGARAR